MTDQQDVFEPDQSIIDNAWVSDWKSLEEKPKAIVHTHCGYQVGT